MRTTTDSRKKSRDLAEIDRDVTARVLDLRVVVRRKATGERLFAVGGRWDRVAGRFLDEPAIRCKTIWLNEAQTLGEPGNALEDGPAWALKTWIEARRAGVARLAEIVYDGGRGSGKTVLGTLAVFLVAVEFPDSRCWLISPANTRKAEIQRVIRDFIPRQWRAWSEREFTYTLPNASTITFIGADDEDALKQGGYEVALLNEAQLISSSAYANAAAGIRNVSGRPQGLLILAHNYASKERGEWTNDHLDKIESGELPAKHFKLDPKLNGFLDVGVVDHADKLIRSVRADLADIDALGIRKRLGDMAAAKFKPFPVERNGHVGSPPAPVVGLDGAVVPGELSDVTREITASKTHTDRGYAFVVGADFQRRPGCVATIGRLFRRNDGETVYVFDANIVAGDNEDDLATRIDEWLNDRGFSARDALVVADSSGRWQNAWHDKRTKPSHAILREYYFTVVAPRMQRVDGKMGNANPDVAESLARFADVCDENRIMVAKEADWLITSLQRCKIKYGSGRVRLDDRKPGYSHMVDCARYVTWYFEPRRGPASPSGYDKQTFDSFKGIRIYHNR